MRIGIAGPISTESLSGLLDESVPAGLKGYSGAPLLGTLIRSLLDRGHEVSGYTLDTSLDPRTANPLVFGRGRFRIYYCPLRRRSFRSEQGVRGKMTDFFRTERKSLMLAIAADQPDLVHAHWSYEFALAAIDSRVPHVVTCHDSPIEVLRYLPSAYRLGRYVMARRVLAKAQILTTVSPYMRDALAKLSARAMEIVPNPIPYALFQASSRNAAIERGAPTRIAMILNGWTRRKNPEPAFMAFAELAKKRPHVELHVFGADFQPGGKAETWAKARQLQRAVVFRGPTEYQELMRELATMQMLLHPALEESFGMTVAEAMTLGVPVIGGRDSGAVPWILADGRCGALTDVRSPAAIETAMATLLDDGPTRTRYVEEGRRRARELFGEGEVAEAYERIYRRACAHESESLV